MALILMIVLLIVLLALYKIYDDKEQEKFDEYINNQKKRDNSSSEKNEKVYREPHLKSDAETQKWLYVYDSMEQLKRENEHFQEELEKMHKKITLLWVIAIIVISFYVIFFLMMASAGVTIMGLIKSLI